jgi:hypothetical protein
MDEPARARVTPGYYDPLPVGRFYGWYSHAWSGYYEPPRVHPYEVYISETTLHDVARNEVVWTGTVKTTDPDNIHEAIEQYVETVMEALEEKNVLRAATGGASSKEKISAAF